jgi:uncharacterized protein YciI
MTNFAVMLVHGPGWDTARPIRSQDGWDEHAAFMDGLVENGFLVVGGPLNDGERTLHLVEAADQDEVRDRFGADPWAVAGLLRIGSIESWALWLDGRHRNPAS